MSIMKVTEYDDYSTSIMEGISGDNCTSMIKEMARDNYMNID